MHSHHMHERLEMSAAVPRQVSEPSTDSNELSFRALPRGAYILSSLFS